MIHQIGFIGLGQMGKWMALNFLKAGCRIYVNDIDPRAQLQERAGRAPFSPTIVSRVTPRTVARGARRRALHLTEPRRRSG